MSDYSKLIYERDAIKGVKESWKRQYANFKLGHRFPFGKTVGEVIVALDALDLDTCSRKDVDAAIGTSGWASIECDDCGQAKDVLVRIGQEPDYDARWVDLCEDCACKAAALFKSARC